MNRRAERSDSSSVQVILYEGHVKRSQLNSSSALIWLIIVKENSMILSERQNICFVLCHYTWFLWTNESVATDKYVDPFIFLFFLIMFMLAKAEGFVHQKHVSWGAWTQTNDIAEKDISWASRGKKMPFSQPFPHSIQLIIPISRKKVYLALD